MYVCVCNTVTDGEIRNAARRGVTSLADLRNELKVASGCGKCEDCARQILNEVLTEGLCLMDPLPAGTS
jgi:bacterioferritin-associated ferredoxin